MRAFVRVAAVAMCCALMVPVIADAKVKRFPTRLAFVDADHESIRAAVRSAFAGCVGERSVSIAERGSGVPFLTTKTAGDGSFSVRVADIPAGLSAVRVTVAQKLVNRRVCERVSVPGVLDDATLSGGPSSGAFRGVLSSSVDACEPGRMISLYEISSDPVFVGWNRTGGSGAWTIAQAGGTYYAQADPTIVAGASGFTYCQPLDSPPWSYEEQPEQSP